MIAEQGRARARFLMLKLLERAREQSVGVPALSSTDYINTIPPEREPWFPGDEHVERRIRAYVRWNAAMMVSRANRPEHRRRRAHRDLRAARASLYEVGFNHFFRGKDHGERRRPGLLPGPRLPRHLRPRVPRGPADRGAPRRRSGRSRRRGGAAVVPAPAADAGLLGVPDRLDGPRPDQRDLPGPVQPLPARTAASRTPSSQRVWCFLGDGEMDEPESLGAIGVAAREELDNLIFVVNCNLQRLDGPVRGNGKIIQELESYFRGAGWNVIKVVWGREWDDAARARRRRRPRQRDEHHARRPVPDLLGRERRLHPRELLRRATRGCARWSST